MQGPVGAPGAPGAPGADDAIADHILLFGGSSEFCLEDGEVYETCPSARRKRSTQQTDVSIVVSLYWHVQHHRREQCRVVVRIKLNGEQLVKDVKEVVMQSGVVDSGVVVALYDGEYEVDLDVSDSGCKHATMTITHQAVEVAVQNSGANSGSRVLLPTSSSSSSSSSSSD